MKSTTSPILFLNGVQIYHLHDAFRIKCDVSHHVNCFDDFLSITIKRQHKGVPLIQFKPTKRGAVAIEYVLLGQCFSTPGMKNLVGSLTISCAHV